MDNPKKNSTYNYYGNELSDEERRELEEIRQRMRQRKRAAAHRRVVRNRIVALIILALIIMVTVKCCSKKSNENDVMTDGSSSSAQTETSANNANADKKVPKQNNSSKPQARAHKIEKTNGMTFVDGILIVNKTYSLPADYNPGTSQLAQNAFDEMAMAAANDGITLFVNSGFRSYYEQQQLYNGYAYERGTDEADKVSSRPGHSEHQTGLTFDVNSTEFSFENTPEAEWLAEHCCEYGFIIRYPKGKEEFTGYSYEPWHIRYLGKETAKQVHDSGMCLEEYLGITSDYKYAEDMTN